MPTDPNQRLSTRMGDSPDEIKALFIEREAWERWLNQETPGALADSFALQLLFGESPFSSSPPTLDSPDPLILKGQLYEKLVEQLKAAKNDDIFWYRLAQWLQFERIREPGKFLPSGVLKRLTQIPAFSGANIRNTYAVRIWLPYTEPLVRKNKWLRERKEKGDSRKPLLELGYAPTAIELAVQGTSSKKTWNSAVEFTCEWVASRGLGMAVKYERETLRNSYSRFLGPRLHLSP